MDCSTVDGEAVLGSLFEGAKAPAVHSAIHNAFIAYYG